MKPGAGEWRSRLLLAAFSVVLTTALAEVAARVLLRPPAPAVPGTPIAGRSPSLGWGTRKAGS